ncbi:lipase family alpha/beta hydrolase [Hymenobacter chitinivorans]|uniref:Alpha/beta hydrolase family protein n=1 Tax=Hymenobacter chitinivorans DSM 11115 TaxID=1121954 RepID=A0A2M9AQW0_9BACT|nr:alpha/beta fold hydrolase [Hymenobacter chitinivorans]PJJ48087.1 alpha/beta hydrolase family protein [Hymenobacter chitinivorans DSM 11115]
MTDVTSPSGDSSDRPSRWRRFSAAARRAVSLPAQGLDYLYHTGQAYRHFTLPILNGAIGDQLAARQDARAIQMSFRQLGADVAVADLHLPGPPRTTVVFLHGLMGDELIWQAGSPADVPRYGPLLQREAGVRCLYVRYNSGLHISQNGQLLAGLLTELLHQHPQDVGELVLVGHSMGGLVIRSAGYYGTHTPTGTPAEWVSRLRSVFLLGVPNDGSFLEQNSHLTSVMLRKINVAPTRFLSKAMDQRSNGIKDLRHAFLVDADWQNPHADDLLMPPRTVVPPLPGVRYHVLVGSLLKTATSALHHYFGDGLVGAGSAVGRVFGDPALPPEAQVQTRVFAQQSHAGLLSNPEVYQYLREHL